MKSVVKLARLQWTSGLVLFSVLPILPADCGPSIYVVHRYRLTGCPDVADTFPSAVEGHPYRLRHVAGEEFIISPGFQKYELSLNGKLREAAQVRLNRDALCTVDVAYGYMGGDVEKGMERSADPLSDIIAGLVMQTSRVTPIVPAARTQRFKSDDMKTWCALTADSNDLLTYRPASVLERASAPPWCGG